MKPKEIFMYVLAGVIITYAFVYLFLLLFKVIPETNRETINLLSGQLVVSGALAVIFYFFGSSKGSHDKDQKNGNT
jgi:sugar phosphate permease